MTNLRNLRIALVAAAIAIPCLLILSSWDIKNNYAAWNDNDYDKYDTIPKKQTKEKKIRDLDNVIDELDNARWQEDMDKAMRELKESMKMFDAQKMQLDMEKAMRDVDFEKMKKEIENSMSKIDFSNIEKEMARAMKEFDGAKLQKEMQESMEKINWEKMQAEFDRVKDIDMKKMHLDMEKMQSELSKIGPEMEKAQVQMEKAKKEMKEYKEFVDGLEKDGLINKKEEYTIKHEDGELFINGKKASEATYNKYKTFLDKHKIFKIGKTADDFKIDID